MEVGNHPVLFSELNAGDRKGEEFSAPQSTAKQKSKDGIVAFAPKTIALRVQQQRAALVYCEPIAESHADAADTFDSADTGGKFGTEEAGISCLVRDTPDRGQAEVDRCWSEAPLFQMNPVPKDNGAIEGKSRFRAVRVNKFVYRVIVRSLTAL